MLNHDEDEAQSTEDFKEELWQISIDNNFELINSYEADADDEEDDDEGYTDHNCQSLN